MPYQCRAPGEMYACFYSGKLKPWHRAVEWLSKLSV